METKPRKLRTFDFNPAVDGGIPFEIADYTQLPADRVGMSLTKIPHRHSFFEILYYTEGSGTHFIDFKPYKLNPPVFYFLSPGQVHFWDVGEPLTGKVILFTADFLVLNPLLHCTIESLPFFYNMMHHPVLEISGAQMRVLDEKIGEMEREYSSDMVGRNTVLQASLYIFLIHLLRLYTEVHPGGTHSPGSLALLRRFKQRIADHPAANLTIPAVAAKLGTSPAHLSDTVKKVTGLSCGKLIRGEVALEAKRLLAHSEMNIAQVGYRLEFEDPSYFGRFFKRETGQSPRQFRNEIQKKYQLFLG